MAAGEYGYQQTADIPNFLRELAAAIENGAEQNGQALPEYAVIAYGAYDEPTRVIGVGMDGSMETIGVLRMAEHVMMNSLMPHGNMEDE